MALLPLSHADDWSEEILEAAKEFFNGEARVMRPGTPGVYDPITNATTGGSAASTVMDWRPARAQHVRLPLENHDSNGWQTERRYRFQWEIRTGDAQIGKGLYVEFRGGKDPTLALLSFQVNSAVNSSHAALRTVEASTEAAP